MGNNNSSRINKLKKFKNNEKGVLGLPLNLLIMVVIAAVAIGLILSWLYLITPPLDYIEVDPTIVDLSDDPTFDITVTAYNSDGPMSGAEIALQGPGIDLKAITGDDGTYTFPDVTPQLPPNSNSDFITVTVSGAGNTVTQSIAVNK